MSVDNDLVPSPSKKRPAPDNDTVQSPSPSKMLKSTPLGPDPSTPPDISSTSLSSSLAAMPAAVPQVPATLVASPASTSAASAAADKRKRRTKEEIEKEKADREAEKEAKREEREEKKRKKDEEEQQKKLEKDAKEQQKKLEKDAKEQQKKLERDTKLQAKEDEKRRLLEEKEKKERSQLRLSSFFAAKSASPNRNRRTPPLPSIGPNLETHTPSKDLSLSEYKRTFLPFNIPSHTRLAPINQLLPDFDSAHLADRIRQIDSTLSSISEAPTDIPFGPPITRGYRVVPVKDIIDLLHGSSTENPIDLTMDAFANPRVTREQAMDLLADTQIKYLHFEEDVRPAYHGTWTKPLMPQEWKHMSRNPCGSKMSILDYDYDSEAEWDDAEEGEDVMSNGDEEEEEDEDEDMNDFLDDTEDVNNPGPKRYIAGQLNPVCSGIQWEDSHGKLQPAHPSSQTVDFSELHMGFLLTPTPITVDPFSTEYWETPATRSSAGLANMSSAPQSSSFKRPALVDKTKKMNGVNPTVPHPTKVMRLLPAEDLDEFRAAIDGQDLTKLAMIEHLKKLFPKRPKDAITNTLMLVAERTGKKSDSKWILKMA